MIVYNELIAITAGAGLLGFAAFLTALRRKDRIDSEGWAGFFSVTGLILFAATCRSSRLSSSAACGASSPSVPCCSR